MSRLRVIPLKLGRANDFVAKHHRHLGPSNRRIHLFSMGAVAGQDLVGVIIVGRPISRHRDDGETLEVSRCCVLPSIENGCSFLYGRAARAAAALGYARIGTYLRRDEPGTSMRVAGWRWIHRTRAQDWHRPNTGRERRPSELITKNLFERELR